MRSNACQSVNSNSVDLHLPGFGGGPQHVAQQYSPHDGRSSDAPLYEEVKVEGIDEYRRSRSQIRTVVETSR